MLSWIGELFTELYNSFIDWILDFFVTVLDALLSLFYTAVNWMIETILDYVIEPITSTVTEKMPPIPEEAVYGFVGYIGHIECWFPVTAAISLLSLYYSIKVSLTLIKYIIKIIPGAGG